MARHLDTWQNSRCFTLVEVLVVMGIVAVIVGLLVPALARARTTSRAAGCLSQVRQIGLAAAMYQNDYDGFIPRESTIGTSPQTLRDRIPWGVAFRPYLDPRCSPEHDLDDMFEAAPYFRCPAKVSGEHRIHYVVNGFAFLAPGIVDERGAAEPSLRRGPMRASSIPFPTSTLYITDLAPDDDGVLFQHFQAQGNTDLSIGQCYDAWLPRHITAGYEDYRIGPKTHGRGANAMFVDGHAAARPTEYFVELSAWDDGVRSVP